jgi:hypothetical protein
MSKQCVDIIAKYLTDNKISGDISINFAPGLTCSGRIISYNKTKNNPESRKFAVWINDVKIYFINLFIKFSTVFKALPFLIQGFILAFFF